MLIIRLRNLYLALAEQFLRSSQGTMELHLSLLHLFRSGRRAFARRIAAFVCLLALLATGAALVGSGK